MSNQAAMDGANGIDIDGRNIRVAFASEKPQGALNKTSQKFMPRCCRRLVVSLF
jgi:hypothetical protein